MKIAILNGSPRKENTAAMVEAFKAGAEEAGNEVCVLHVGRMKIGGCLGCEYCHGKGEGQCVQKDDMGQVIDAYKWADMLVFASPIYYSEMTSQLHAAIQRVYSIGKPVATKYRASLQNYVIDTGDDVILVDTGLPKETPNAVWDGKAHSYMGRWIEDYVSALRTAGYEPSQVTKIVLTHKHSDHSGEIRSFPNAKFYVNRVEIESDEVKALKDHPGLTPVDFTDGPYYNFTRSQIIAPGVRMIPAPGHTYGNSIVIAEDGGLFYMFHGDISYTDEAIYADKLSIVYDDIHMTRSTQNAIREFIRNHPTVYCGTHTPLGYENLEAKRVMDLDNPPKTVWPNEDYFVTNEGTGKYICSICGYVYDPAEHDGVAFEELPEDWKCPRCKQGKEKFNKA